MKKQVSFIIPHKGREEFLVQTVDSIIAQHFDPALFEILIISQNKSLAALSELAKSNSNLKIYYRPDGMTISALRNYGATQATGEYLAFLDADVFLSSNWITCMLATLAEKESRLLVSASQINGTKAPPLERIRTALSNAELDCNVNFLPGRNLFLSRETFEKVNGFPEHLLTCEDYYFTDQVHQLGELYYTSAATYVHLGEDKKYNEMYKKEIWRGQSNLQSIKGRKIPLRELPSFIIPLGLMALLVICLISLLAGNAAIAILAISLLSIPFIAYSIRLYLLAKSDVSFWHVFKFYLTYFPARAIGTLGGLFKSFSNTKLSTPLGLKSNTPLNVS